MTTDPKPRSRSGARAEDSTPPSQPFDLAAQSDFTKLYTRWFADVGRWIGMMGGRGADVDDMTQKVFVVALRRLPDFDGKNAAAWLYQIARRCVCDWRRESWTKCQLDSRAIPVEDFKQPGQNPAELIQARHDAAHLCDRMQSLSANERSALLLFAVWDYTGQEIAGFQGVPLNTVWTRIHRARQKVRADTSLRRELVLGDSQPPSQSSLPFVP